MAKFEETDGFIVKGWMRLRLGLSGGELFAYAIVYHFSQKSGAGVYIGGVPYLAAFIGCTQNTARTYLHNLTQRGLIIRIDATSQGVPFQHFKANPAFIPNIQDTPQKFEDTPQKFEGGGTPKKFEVESNIDNKIYSPHFIPPALEAVQAYSEIRDKEGRPHIDAQAFLNYYDSVGWKVGGKPMKDWKAAFRTWEDKRRQEEEKKTPKHRSIKWDEIR